MSRTSRRTGDTVDRRKYFQRKDRGKTNEKPKWDNTVSDMSRYKLTPEAQMRRKISFLSPNRNKALRSLRKARKKKKKSSLSVVVHDTGEKKKNVNKDRSKSALDMLNEDETRPAKNRLRDADFEDELRAFEETVAVKKDVTIEDGETDSKLFEEMAALLGETEATETKRREDAPFYVDENECSFIENSSVTSSVVLKEVDDILDEVEDAENVEPETSTPSPTTTTTAKPSQDPTVLKHLVTGLERRLARFGTERAAAEEDEDPANIMPRLLRVCDGLMRNLTKSSLMQQHQQEELLRVRLDADKWQREYRGLKTQVEIIRERVDKRLTTTTNDVSSRRTTGGNDPSSTTTADFGNDEENLFEISASPPIEYVPENETPSATKEDEKERSRFSQEYASSPSSERLARLPAPRPAERLPKPVASPVRQHLRLATRNNVQFQSPNDLSLARATKSSLVKREELPRAGRARRSIRFDGEGGRKKTTGKSFRPLILLS